MSTSLTKQSDILVIIGVIFLTITHFITMVTVYSISNHQVTAQQVAQAYEGNPLAVGLVSSLNGFSIIIQYIVMPAISLSAYYIMRKKMKDTQPMVLYFISLFVFFSGMLNLINDTGALAGVLLQQGYI
jgi:hypothetical protein